MLTGTLDEILDLHRCKCEVKLILSEYNVKSIVNAAKPRFTSSVTTFHHLIVNIGKAGVSI